MTSLKVMTVDFRHCIGLPPWSAETTLSPSRKGSEQPDLCCITNTSSRSETQPSRTENCHREPKCSHIVLWWKSWMTRVYRYKNFHRQKHGTSREKDAPHLKLLSHVVENGSSRASKIPLFWLRMTWTGNLTVSSITIPIAATICMAITAICLFC